MLTPLLARAPLAKHVSNPSAKVSIVTECPRETFQVAAWRRNDTVVLAKSDTKGPHTAILTIASRMTHPIEMNGNLPGPCFFVKKTYCARLMRRCHAIFRVQGHR